MRITTALLASSLALVGCKKSGTGGGGGGWLVGSAGLMANVNTDGQLAGDYPLGATETLYGIACRFDGEAFVVGAHGTILYTDDGGQSWISLASPATGDLRALATQDAGPVFVAGDRTLMLSLDGGDSFSELSDGHTDFRSIAAAQRASTVLAISADSGFYAYDGHALARRATIDGARAVGVSPDGRNVIVAGNGIDVSHDSGLTFRKIDVTGHFESARIDDNGEGIAVGEAGTVAHVIGDSTLVNHVGTSNLHTVHMKTWGEDTASGYLAGEDGQVYLTSDAGWSWTKGPNVGRAVYGADEIGAGHN